MKKANCVFLIGLILFLNILSINSNSTYPSINSLESASEGADNPLRVGTYSLGYDLDPILAWDRTSLDIIDQVWEGLYAHNLGDPRLRIVPRLAADCGSWNENATVFNVSLRAGITFHNGNAFTAADVNYTFSRLWQLCVFHEKGLIDSSQPYGIRDLYFPYGFNTTKMNASVGYGFIINKTVIVDDLHVSFELNFPYVPFQSLLCCHSSYIMDASTTNIDTFLTFANIANHAAIGTGPYKITEHNTEKCSFEYWEDYYRGVPAIKKIEFLRPRSISQALLAGEIDFSHSYDSDLIPEFEKNSEINVSSFHEKSSIRFIYLNNMKINKTYRHAINYAINYDKIINEVLDGAATRATSIVPPGISYHKDCNVPIFNLSIARHILIEAGYTESYGLDEQSSDEEWKEIAESANPVLTLKYAFFLGNPKNENQAYLIRDNLKDIGINVDFRAMGYEFYIDLYDWYSEYDMYPIAILPDYNDPSQIINMLMSNTSSWYFTPLNDHWLQLTMNEALTIVNEEDRKALYYDIQDYIASDLMPYVLISNRLVRSVHANYVTTQPNPMYKFYVFPFSWHGVNTTFNDPYLDLWCNSGSPPVLEFWPEIQEHIPGYSMFFISIFSLVIVSLWIQKNKKKLEI